MAMMPPPHRCQVVSVASSDVTARAGWKEFFIQHDLDCLGGEGNTPQIMGMHHTLEAKESIQMYHPHLAICGTGDPFETRLIDGRFPNGTLHLPRMINHKENNEADGLLAPENGCRHHFTEINYLFLF